MANSAELGLSVPREGHFWMREYWDRYIRDEKHFHNVVDYIQANPVKAGLCREPHDWPWSSRSVTLGTPFPLGTLRPSSAQDEEEQRSQAGAWRSRDWRSQAGTINRKDKIN